MRKRIVTFTLALTMALAAMLTACGKPASATGLPNELPTQQAGPANTQTTQQVGFVNAKPSPTLKPGPSAGVTLITDEHISYIVGAGSGLFSPNKYITRAEAAVILYRLLADTVPVTVTYSDVPESSWYFEAAGQLGSMGVARPNESTFNGNEYLSRGEFISYIACFFPMRTDAEQFPDVPSDYAYRDAILSARAWGWVVGFTDGTCGPNNTIRRSEAVAIINRALGRTGDTASIAADRPALFLDVPVTEWYYTDVMEATVAHTFTVTDSGAEKWTASTPSDPGLPKDFRTEGIHFYQGWSYYYSEETKDIFRNRTVSGNTYDASGHFTTGDTWVDEQLRSIVLSQTDSGMTREEMLKAFFAYCRDTYKYLKWNYYDTGDTSFTLDAARQMLSTGRGNCYCYASVFFYLARWIGYDAKIISGSLVDGPHSWVEINGYIYDTQLEWRYYHDKGRTQYLWYFYHLSPSKSKIKYIK